MLHTNPLTVRDSVDGAKRCCQWRVPTFNRLSGDRRHAAAFKARARTILALNAACMRCLLVQNTFFRRNKVADDCGIRSARLLGCLFVTSLNCLHAIVTSVSDPWGNRYPDVFASASISSWAVHSDCISHLPPMSSELRVSVRLRHNG